MNYHLVECTTADQVLNFATWLYCFKYPVTMPASGLTLLGHQFEVHVWLQLRVTAMTFSSVTSTSLNGSFYLPSLTLK
jgi:hypothetical protein